MQSPVNQAIALKIRGGGEIRTPGTFQYDGFQDRSIKPLWHSSVWMGRKDSGFLKNIVRGCQKFIFSQLRLVCWQWHPQNLWYFFIRFDLIEKSIQISGHFLRRDSGEEF